MKKWNPWYLAAIASVAPLGALGGAIAGHAVVLLITMGIFVGTLSLNRIPVPQGPTAQAASVDQIDKQDEATRRRSLPA